MQQSTNMKSTFSTTASYLSPMACNLHQNFGIPVHMLIPPKQKLTKFIADSVKIEAVATEVQGPICSRKCDIKDQNTKCSELLHGPLFFPHTCIFSVGVLFV